jgi:RNA-directed DNA polymerase
VKDRYFKVQGARRWVFSCAEKSADGRKRQYTLLDASDTPIVRHIKVKAAANPHDPEWDEYFESRWGKRMLTSVKGRAKLYRIWVQQGGRCCACFKPVTKDTPWHSRHIVKPGHGGTDAASNLEIYHLRCPRDVQFANVDDV